MCSVRHVARLECGVGQCIPRCAELVLVTDSVRPVVLFVRDAVQRSPCVYAFIEL